MRPPPFVLRAAAAHFERQQRNAHANAERQQAALLRRILRRYRDTELAAELGVRDIQSAAQFRREVPARSTADYLPIWNRAKAQNRPGMVHPQALRYMALKTNGLNQCLPAPKEQFDAHGRKAIRAPATDPSMPRLVHFESLSDRLPNHRDHPSTKLRDRLPSHRDRLPNHRDRPSTPLRDRLPNHRDRSVRLQ